MSLLTTHFSRAYSPRVAFNSVTGFDSPANKPAMAGECSNALGFFVDHRSAGQSYDGLDGETFGSAGYLFPVCQPRSACHPWFDSFRWRVSQPKTRRPIMATLSLRDRASKLNPLHENGGEV